MKPLIIAVLSAALFATSSTIAQVPPDKAEATFTVHNPDLEWKLWASEPLFVNPTCIDIDHMGRVWVCESVNYRTKFATSRSIARKATASSSSKTPRATGKADKATVFYQSPDLLAPLGIAVAKDPVGPGYKVFVCQSPDILVFEDKDGDGKADGPPKKLLTGFGGIDHDHGVHGILIGPDGKLYFTVGDPGVQEPAKHRRQGPQMDQQQHRLPGRHHLALRHGRQEPRTDRPQLPQSNTSRASTASAPSSSPTTTTTATSRRASATSCPAATTATTRAAPARPLARGAAGHRAEILRTYFGSPTGMCVYEGTLLPKKYWGQLLHTDAGPRQVRCYHLKPKGAGYDVEREDIVTSTDNWFRPSDVCVAPDGSVFVADWYDPGVGGHGMGDSTRGRIYRLAPKGNKVYRAQSRTRTAKDGLLSALGSPTWPCGTWRWPLE